MQIVVAAVDEGQSGLGESEREGKKVVEQLRGLEVDGNSLTADKTEGSQQARGHGDIDERPMNL